MQSLRRLGYVLTLALALCLGQYATLMHDLGHATGQIHKQDSKSSSTKCDECFACAQLAGGAPATLPTVPTVTCGIDGVAVTEQFVVTAALLAYRSQAPPALL
ncbi:MAG: hypothetical protein ABIQ72_14870 [Usitatibacter sp.]